MDGALVGVGSNNLNFVGLAYQGKGYCVQIHL
jgi:hypothetical protein